MMAHPGTGVFIQQTARAFFEEEMLDSFLTTFIDHPDFALSRALKHWLGIFYPSIHAEFSRRSLKEIPFSKCKTYPYPEMVRTLASKFGAPSNWVDAIWEWAELSFDRWAARQIRPGLDAIYTYEHAALETLRTAKQMGKVCFYEQPSSHYTFFQDVLMRELAGDALPSKEQVQLYLGEKSKKRNRRRAEEIQLADYVVCNSAQVEKTLTRAGVPEKKILRVSLGFPEVDTGISSGKTAPAGKKIVFLSAGTQSVRKGSHLLYRAWTHLNLSPDTAELWIIGKMDLPHSLSEGLPGTVKKWPSIPRDELLEKYKEASVFLLPSLEDGFGMVATEAMSRGVPVIATDAVGMSDFIRYGVNGWIVPAGDENALAGQMKWCVENRGLLPSFSQAVLETASKWQWADYRKAIARAVSEKIELHANPAHRRS